MARILGIDLGAHAVKLALFEGSFGRHQLVGYHHSAVAQQDEEPPSLSARIEALRVLLAELPEGGSTVSGATFPTEHTSVRAVSLPFADRKLVEKTLTAEVENIVPFDLETMLLASRFLGVENGSTKVLVALAEKDRVRTVLHALKEEGVDPKVLVVDGDLLGAFAGEGVQAVVDFGHSRTLVTLCRDGAVLSTRSIQRGGHHVTIALGEALGIPYAEAELRKHRTPIEIPQGELLAAHVEERTDPVAIAPDGRLIASALLPLVVELRGSLLASEDTLGLEIDELILTGGASAQPGLREWLGEVLGVPVRSVMVSDEAQNTGHPGAYAIAHAAGVLAANGKGRPLDLRIGEFAFKGDLATIGLLVRYLAVAAIAFIVAGVSIFAWKTNAYERQLEEIDAAIASAVITAFPDVDPAKVKDASMAMAIMQEKTIASAGRVGELGSLLSVEPPTLGTIRTLSADMPPPAEVTIDVSELSITDSAITMKADTDGFEQAGKIETALQQNARFKSARKGDEKKTGEKVRFTITIPLGESEGDADEG